MLMDKTFRVDRRNLLVSCIVYFNTVITYMKFYSKIHESTRFQNDYTKYSVGNRNLKWYLIKLKMWTLKRKPWIHYKNATTLIAELKWPGCRALKDLSALQCICTLFNGRRSRESENNRWSSLDCAARWKECKYTADQILKNSITLSF